MVTSSRPNDPQATAAAQNRACLETTLLYLLAKLVAAPRATAEALLARINIDSLGSMLPTAGPRPPADLRTIMILVDGAQRHLNASDAGAALRSLQVALAMFADLVEAGRAAEAVGLCHHLLNQFASQSPWPLYHLLELAAGGASYLERGQLTPSAHETKLFLGGATNAKANDFFNWATAAARPPLPIDPSGGVLGLERDGVLQAVVGDIERDGYHLFDRRLPHDTVGRLYAFAAAQRCHPQIANGAVDHAQAVAVDLDAEYDGFHVPTEAVVTSPDIQRLLIDPSFAAVAQGYFGCQPVYTSTNLWWSTPSNRAPNSELAQQFHYDMEWWRWLKFFVYLTDVDAGGGPHVYVRRSHHSGSKPTELLARGYVRIPDDDIRRHYAEDDIVSVTAPAGSVLVGDTRCWHKGAHPTTKPRLLLQFEWASTLVHGAPGAPIRLAPDCDPELRSLIQQYPYRFQQLAL